MATRQTLADPPGLFFIYRCFVPCHLQFLGKLFTGFDGLLHGFLQLSVLVHEVTPLDLDLLGQEQLVFDLRLFVFYGLVLVGEFLVLLDDVPQILLSFQLLFLGYFLAELRELQFVVRLDGALGVGRLGFDHFGCGLYDPFLEDGLVAFDQSNRASLVGLNRPGLLGLVVGFLQRLLEVRDLLDGRIELGLQPIALAFEALVVFHDKVLVQSVDQ
mmetsp:Transcript_17586/g.40502  ORF Transcript_17586/g.40502 Transcript_17586/m.40502 type:complete len:215 (+) Transcript_17586:435-1079(+)